MAGNLAIKSAAILALLFACNVDSVWGSVESPALPPTERADLFSAPLQNDNFLDFIENQNYFSNIEQMQENHLAKGAATAPPWSGPYWPTHKGMLGERYADPSFPMSKVFIDNYSYYESHPSEMYVLSGNINQLSPAEKYDLLVGDRTWSLTRSMWAKGYDGYQKDGFVATWTGICHGLAGADVAEVPMPVRSVSVKDVTGAYSITFYANDIRALASYLWAESSPIALKAGDRCRQATVVTDPYLRPTDPSCLDGNPMTWHMTVTNRLGLHGKSFVMDANKSAEVWNYALASYDYSYFNPRTFETSHSLAASIVDIDAMTNDKYKAYRSPQTKYLVGVIMDVYHPALTEPHPGSSSDIVTQTHTFSYDLELDSSMNIIGGEWYSDARPDFIWTFPKGNEAGNREDTMLDGKTWDPNTQISTEMAGLAVQASQRGKVLAKITNALVQSSVGADTENPPTH